ncbi:MAG: DUF302 domain-containing protein [Proteobacteria bacterium]|nr:DUF302 domain-containing protein [Pseudomonadota bacterium]
MRKLLKVAVLALFSLFAISPLAQASDQGMIYKKSPYGVKETMDRLEKVFKEKGVTVFARVNHAAGAKKIGAELRPTETLIFGTPKIGTPLMQSDQHIGIDLPLKILAWMDEKGQVMIAYNDPKFLAERHHIKNRDTAFEGMAVALDKLTTAALKK